jgi:hypothetical protein
MAGLQWPSLASVAGRKAAPKRRIDKGPIEISAIVNVSRGSERFQFWSARILELHKLEHNFYRLDD